MPGPMSICREGWGGGGSPIVRHGGFVRFTCVAGGCYAMGCRDL